MFIRYTTNTKKIKTGTCVYDGYYYEVNRNGIHFIYVMDACAYKSSYKIVQIIFIKDVTVGIKLFTGGSLNIWVNNKTRVVALINYNMKRLDGKYDYISKNCYSRGILLQLVGAHHDLLRSLRAVSLV